MQFLIVTCLLVHYEAEKIDDFTLFSNVISKTHAEYLLKRKYGNNSWKYQINTLLICSFRLQLSVRPQSALECVKVLPKRSPPTTTDSSSPSLWTTGAHG